jgi:GNAT superfamily N-acetyltransferase
MDALPDRPTHGSPVPLEDLGPEDERALTTADLSPWFNPFLAHFVRETLRCGGRVQVVRGPEGLAGLRLDDPVENVASIFTRSSGVARSFAPGSGGRPTYSDLVLGGPSDRYYVYAGRLGPDTPQHPFRHRVRPVEPGDRSRVLELMHELHGTADVRWFREAPSPEESGFLVQVGDRVAGAAWVAVVAGVARLHSLAVRPTFRRLGVGTDLLFARLLWARRAGARQVLSEISEANPASRRIAERGGMRPVGELFLYPAPSPAPVGQVRAAPQNGHFSAVESMSAPQ